MKEFAVSLQQYLQGLQKQITARSQDIEALKEEMARMQNTLHQIQQRSFEYEVIELQSKINSPPRTANINKKDRLSGL